MPDLPLDKAAADRAEAIFCNLRLPDVPGQPLMGDACGDWFKSIVRAAFGSVDPDTGERAVGEIFCLVPKKNSKTTNSAALGITALLVNQRPNVEMLIIGPTKDVADTCFRQMKGMIEADPIDPITGEAYLPNRFHVADHEKKITDRRNGATLKIKAFDMRVVTGSIPALVIVDELHVLGASNHAARVLAQIRGGMITRPDSLLLFITTQSDEPPAGVFKSELQYARRVRDGLLMADDGADEYAEEGGEEGDEEGGGHNNLLPILYEFPEAIQMADDKPWRDPRLWPMVLPNLGRSITIGRLKVLYRKALEKGPDEEIRWASQHLNVQVGFAAHSDRWSGAMFWQDAARRLTLEEILETSDCVTAGIDGGGLDDLLALTLIGRHRETEAWQVWSKAWALPSVFKRRKDIVTRLEGFKEDGDLVACTEPNQDLRDVADILADVYERGLLPEEFAVGLDPFGIMPLKREIVSRGVPEGILIAIKQGTSLMPAISIVGRQLEGRKIHHCGQPILDWAVSNARTIERDNAQMVTKAESGRGKIDPLMALFNAAMLMGRDPEASGGGSSPWDDPNFKLPR